MRFSLHPRDPALHAFLKAPGSLSEDPVWRRLTDRIHRARAMHMPVRELEKARQDYVTSLLRKCVEAGR